MRRELFDGIIKLMSPASSIIHQRISKKIFRKIDNYLLNKICGIFYAPSDVRFPNEKNNTDDKQTFTVVQPDIFVVCDLSKLDNKGCIGPPDLIIEIVSPKNSKRDIKDKYEIYEAHGVFEYWIVNPNDENVNVFVLT